MQVPPIPFSVCRQVYLAMALLLRTPTEPAIRCPILLTLSGPRVAFRIVVPIEGMERAAWMPAPDPMKQLCPIGFPSRFVALRPGVHLDHLVTFKTWLIE